MTKPTPGQWDYDPEDRVIIREGDADIAHMDQSASEADARLITAAPELLKALEDSMGILITGVAGRVVYEQAINAIRKAKGDPK